MNFWFSKSQTANDELLYNYDLDLLENRIFFKHKLIQISMNVLKIIKR